MLESKINLVSKVLEDYQTILAVKVKDMNCGNKLNSRQQFSNIFHKDSNNNYEHFNFAEHRSALFSTEDQNCQSLASIVNSKMSKIEESDEESNRNDYAEISRRIKIPSISVVESIKTNLNTNSAEVYQDNSDKKQSGISIYNPLLPSTRADFHRSMHPIKSMTCSEVEAEEGCKKALNSTLKHFENDTEEKLNFDSGSSKILLEERSPDFARVNKKEKGKKKNDEEGDDEIKNTRMRPKKKEQSSDKKEESKNKRKKKLEDKGRPKPSSNIFNSFAGKNKRTKEGDSNKSENSGTTNSKLRSLSYFDNLEYSGDK